MKDTLIIYLLLLSYALKAQQTSIVGTVAVFNSKTETGKRQFIQYAQVEKTCGKYQATTTNTEGYPNRQNLLKIILKNIFK